MKIPADPDDTTGGMDSIKNDLQTDLTPPFNWKAFSIVALVCGLGAAWSGSQLEALLSATGGAGVGEPLAKIERRENNVRRKVGSSYVWNNATEQEKLYKSDSIRTAQGSTATIQFNDGALLEVGENSLVVIDEIENLALNFKEGTVVVKAKDGSDTKISVDSEGKKKVEKLNLRLSSPEPYSEKYVAQGASTRIQFAWEQRAGKAEPGKYRLEVASDRGFRSGLKSIPIEKIESTSSAQLDLSEGQYFWRITQDGKPLTQSGRFRVIAASPVKPIEPGQGAQITTWAEKAQVAFRWVLPGDEDSHYKGVSHELEIASDPGFKSILTRQKLSPQARSTLVPLAQGRFWWRIKSHYGAIEARSPELGFLHEAGRKVALQLAFPTDSAETPMGKITRLAWGSLSDAQEYKWEVKDSDGKIQSSGKSGGQSASWNPKAPGAYQWRVIAANSEGNTIGESAWRPLKVIREEPSRLGAPAPLALTPKALPAVEVDRVKALAPEAPAQVANPAQAKAQVAPAPVVVEKIAPPRARFPAENARFELLEKDFDTTFSWDGPAQAKKYDITIAKSDSGSARGRAPASLSGSNLVKHEVVSEPKLRIKNLPPGRYLWSVKSIDSAGKMSESAETRSFVIEEGALLGAPDEISAEVQ